MKRVEQIRVHPMYQHCLGEIQKQERERIFCGHDMGHFLDVARLMHIQNLEEGLNLNKEVIYAAALLHDIGRYEEYRNGVPHEEAGAVIAEQILADTDFASAECIQIVEAIRAHRSIGQEGELGRILYRADKAVRNCFACDAAALCNWDEEKKNMTIKG